MNNLSLKYWYLFIQFYYIPDNYYIITMYISKKKRFQLNKAKLMKNITVSIPIVIMSIGLPNRNITLTDTFYVTFVSHNWSKSM